MIVNVRVNDKIPHVVVWESRVSGSMFRTSVKEKEFDNFMDASGFAAGLQKRGIKVIEIINLCK